MFHWRVSGGILSKGYLDLDECMLGLSAFVAEEYPYIAEEVSYTGDFDNYLFELSGRRLNVNVHHTRDDLTATDLLELLKRQWAGFSEHDRMLFASLLES